MRIVPESSTTLLLLLKVLLQDTDDTRKSLTIRRSRAAVDSGSHSIPGLSTLLSSKSSTVHLILYGEVADETE